MFVTVNCPHCGETIHTEVINDSTNHRGVSADLADTSNGDEDIQQLPGLDGRAEGVGGEAYERYARDIPQTC